MSSDGFDDPGAASGESAAGSEGAASSEGAAGKASAVASWQPPAAGTLPDTAVLRRLGALQRDAGEALPELPEDLRSPLQGAMRAPRGALDDVIAALDSEDLPPLIRFFTRIEAQPGWEAGERSPVVPLMRHWRRTATPEDVDALVRWVKSHTDNRFLPHGSLQDRLRA